MYGYPGTINSLTCKAMLTLVGQYGQPPGQGGYGAFPGAPPGMAPSSGSGGKFETMRQEDNTDLSQRPVCHL
jgi:hypothetical protein